MTPVQGSLLAAPEAQRRKPGSLCDRLAEFFKAHPGEWLGARELEFAGRQAWRTRVSNLRKPPYSMTIENRVEVRTYHGELGPVRSRHYKASFYRYVPLQAVTVSASGDPLTSAEIGVDFLRGQGAPKVLETRVCAQNVGAAAPTSAFLGGFLQHSVYRYYDRLAILIYVGVTSRGIERNREHNSDKSWWPLVVRQKVDHFGTLEEALAREKALIRKYGPPFNTAHNPNHDDMHAAYARVASSIDAHADAVQMMLKLGRVLPFMAIAFDPRTHVGTFRTDWQYAAIVKSFDPSNWKPENHRIRFNGEVKAAHPMMQIRGGLLLVKAVFVRGFIPQELIGHLCGKSGGGVRLKSLELVTQAARESFAQNGRPLAPDSEREMDTPVSRSGDGDGHQPITTDGATFREQKSARRPRLVHKTG